VRLQLELLEIRELLSGFKLGALTQVSGLSPFAGNRSDSGQPGINYLNSEVEPTLGVDPTNPNHLVAAWQQDRWSNSGCRGLVDAVSFNGGQTWTPPSQGVIPSDTLVSGGIYQRTSDPWLAFGSNGNLLISGNPFDITDGNEIMASNKSTDGGLTWSQPVATINDTQLNVIDDKESVTIDPTNPNLAYMVWERLVTTNPSGTSKSTTGPTWLARSTDGGNTWQPATIIFDPGNQAQTIGNQIIVMPNGDLVDVFDLINYHRNDGGNRNTNVAIIRSTDKGLTWSAPIIVSGLQSITDTDPNTGQTLRTGNIVPEAALDRNSGNLYLVWEDARFSGGTHNDIAFSMSSDGGFTWSAPIKVNQTPGNIPVGDQQAFTASVAVAANGTVAVSYYDLRNNVGGPGLLTDYWIVQATPSAPGGLTNPANWGNEARLTNTSFNMENAPTSDPNTAGYFVGDYEWLAAGGKDGNTFDALFCMPQGSDPSNAYFRTASVSGSNQDALFEVLLQTSTNPSRTANIVQPTSAPMRSAATLLAWDQALLGNSSGLNLVEPPGVQNTVRSQEALADGQREADRLWDLVFVGLADWAID
jgi:hypothetical protein